MPSSRQQAKNLYHGSLLLSPLFLHLISAQAADSAAAPSDITGLGAAPTALYPNPAAASFAAIPSSTDNAGYAGSTTTDNSNGSGDVGRNTGFQNYWFVPLALLPVLSILAYMYIGLWCETKNARSQTRQQDALAVDLERWPGGRRRWGAARWRFHNVGGDTMGREGLNERGEAPPPYIAKPDPVHRGGGDAARQGDTVELSDLTTVEGKPPDYEHRWR